MRPPEVYFAINAITTELSRDGIPKLHYNQESDYFYRSIDDVLNRLAPLLAIHRLCVLPRVLQRSALERIGLVDVVLNHVTLKVAFDLVSVVDGSSHTAKAFGEALDEGDKATAKAMSAAYKSAMLQVFCIPVASEGDSDRQTLRLRTSGVAEPVQGWDQWSRDVIEMIRVCESQDALTRVQDSRRAELKAVQRARADLYAKIGEEFAVARTSLIRQSETAPVPRQPRRRSRSSAKVASAIVPAEMQHG